MVGQVSHDPQQGHPGGQGRLEHDRGNGLITGNNIPDNSALLLKNIF